MNRLIMQSIPVAAVLAACAIALPCRAAPTGTPRFGDLRTTHPRTQKYTCATGRTFNVTYLGAANGQSFALVPVNGQQMLFVNTLSGSGAKYQAGSYTWWTKGTRADLYDAMAGPDAPPVLSNCITVVR
ncbi:MliC family protein [Paraburkholderia rhizosphaerae]|uniref:MliC family protein n=1 Tax=Paraburkholderia rhizosphaerae TaxID=480658 RepID=UPI0035F0E92F